MTPSKITSLRVIRPRRIYEQIAEQIEALIRSRELPTGSKLPGERELAEQLGVSRPSVREALIALEASGMIEFRPSSGNFVRDPTLRSLATIERQKDLGPGPMEQFEARRAMEPACAALAAERATPEQIEALAASLRRMQAAVTSGGNPSEEHRSFHTLLAEASRNSILHGAVRELWIWRQGSLWDGLRRRVENVESFKAGLAFRHRLLELLRARDAPGARAAMEEHFARVSRLYFDSNDE